MINSWRLFVGFLILISLVKCASEQDENQIIETGPKAIPVNQVPSKVPQYETVLAQVEDIPQSLKISGRLQFLEKLQIASEVPGKALKTPKLLNEGIRYQKGEALVQIDNRQQILNLKAQKSQFQSALVRIMSQIELDYPEAHPAWDGYLKAFDLGEPLKDLPEVSEDQLKFFLSANGVFSTFYTIKSAEIQLPKYLIKAPFSGVITQGSISPGAIINPGIPLATYSRTDVFELKAAVSSSNVSQLRPGQKLKLIHQNTGQSWMGKVHRLGGTIDAGTQAIPVFIRVSGKGLREGMFLETSLNGENQSGVVVLPLTALNRTNEIHQILDSTVVLKKVEPVHYEQDQVWVKGLDGGEVIITETIDEPIVGTKGSTKS